MARFVMANRRAGKFQTAEKVASRAALDAGFNELFAPNVDVVNDRNPVDPLARRVVVFDADPEEVAARAAALPADVLVEPEILHFPTAQGVVGGGRPRLVGMDTARTLDTTLAGPQTSVSVMVTGAGTPLAGASVLLFVVDQGGRQMRLDAVSDGTGMAVFSVPVALQPVGAVVLPAGGFWSMVVRSSGTSFTVDCPAIPSVGPLDWWHRTLGVTQLDLTRGQGIRVGVIDTGVGPHACLAHVTSVGAFIDGNHDPAGGADVDSHGSHVCGTIGARPVDAATHRAGVAPGVDLFCARVFPDADSGASQADIANALDELSRERGVDLVNMSLGATQPSQIELDAIRDALQRGTLCVCAAGNDSGAVNWPGAFAETVAVSALGMRNTAPAGSISSGRLPTDPSKLGVNNLFLANFSSNGNEVTCGAPGVGIIATVPERFGLTAPYAAMDGTSMASPAACGALAALLANAPSYLALQGMARAEEARTILSSNCVSIGLSARFQGRGLPQVM